jgi:hypothetical protein
MKVALWIQNAIAVAIVTTISYAIGTIIYHFVCKLW